MKIIPQFLLTLFLLILFVDVNAQEKLKKTSVYLLNGNILTGSLKDHINFDFIELQITDSISIKIPQDAIRKITNYKLYPLGYLSDKKGLITIIELGLNFREGNSNEIGMNGISFHIINNYKLSKYFSGGLGIGIDNLNRLATIPLYLSLRGDVLKGVVTPVYQADIGYGFVSETWEPGTTKGGLYLHPGVGIKFYARRLAFGLNTGYKIQKSSYSHSTPTFEVNEKRTFRRITLRTLIYF